MNKNCSAGLPRLIVLNWPPPMIRLPLIHPPNAELTSYMADVELGKLTVKSSIAPPYTKLLCCHEIVAVRFEDQFGMWRPGEMVIVHPVVVQSPLIFVIRTTWY